MRRIATLACLAVSLAPAARAADFRFDGTYRLRFDSQTNLLLDETGFRAGQGSWGEHRLRLEPKITEEGLAEIQASFDVVSGIFAGDVASNFRGYGLTDRSVKNGIRAQGFDFRHFFATLRTPAGLFQFGQMPSTWGMGMLANSGNGEYESDFGDPRYGDIVERVLYATRPLVGLLGPKSTFARHVAWAVGGDLVYRDRYAQLLVRNAGGVQWADTAWQLLSAVVYDPSDRTRAGLYVVRRIQSFASNGGDLHVWIFDGHLRHALELPFGVLSFEAEGAEIYGGTSHAPNLSAPGTTRVNQQGAAGRATLALGRWEAEVEGGYASGDANPFDDQSNAFQMNRDFKVGLVLFDEVLMFQTQNAARRLSDPALSGVPPRGLDLLPSEGAVTNALYLRPTIRFKPAAFGGAFRLVGSALFARAPQPVLDPYNTLLASAPRNTFATAAGRDYGLELDGAVSWFRKIAEGLGVEAGVQAGYLFPGGAFTRLDGSRMPGAGVFRLRGTFTF